MNPGTMDFLGAALLIGDEWVNAGLDAEVNLEEQIPELLNKALRLGLDLLFPDDAAERELPAEGLEAVTLYPAEA